jgi:hypothetical protein
VDGGSPSKLLTVETEQWTAEQVIEAVEPAGFIAEKR